MLVTAEMFRDWSGGTTASVSDALIDATLAEAQAAVAEEVDATIDVIAGNPNAAAIARGDILRRASNLLAARNSPEGVAGSGEFGVINIPAGHPLSARAVRQIRAALGIPEAVA